MKHIHKINLVKSDWAVQTRFKMFWRLNGYTPYKPLTQCLVRIFTHMVGRFTACILLQTLYIRLNYPNISNHFKHIYLGHIINIQFVNTQETQTIDIRYIYSWCMPVFAHWIITLIFLKVHQFTLGWEPHVLNPFVRIEFHVMTILYCRLDMWHIINILYLICVPWLSNEQVVLVSTAVWIYLALAAISTLDCHAWLQVGQPTTVFLYRQVHSVVPWID